MSVAAMVWASVVEMAFELVSDLIGDLTGQYGDCVDLSVGTRLFDEGDHQLVDYARHRWLAVGYVGVDCCRHF